MNFDKHIMQQNTHDEKHDQMKTFFGRDDLLAMWVAEMDFETAPAIKEALMKRCEHAIFGYSYRYDEYYKAIIEWYKKRYKCKISQDMLSFDTGVMRSLFELIRIFSKEQDEILIPTPAYAQFFKVIKRSKRKKISYPLVEQSNRFYFEEKALMEKLSTCAMMVLCSPHNPSGQIWSEEELRMIARCCKKTNTVLVSDEIHCDLAMKPSQFITMLKIDPSVIVLNSPSKAFNLAGLQHSFAICQNPAMQKRISQYYEENKIKSYQTLSMLALEVAYTKADQYLLELCEYLAKNQKTVRAYIEEKHLNIPVFVSDAGYLLWMDFRAYFQDGTQLNDFLVNTCRVATTFGDNFDDERFTCFTRLNIATQRDRCLKAMKRIELGLRKEGYL